MALRPNSKNWPVWVAAVATAWFVAITFAWALRPLTDHVPITVAHLSPTSEVVPGQRDQGPTIDVTCGTPAGGSADDAGGLPDLNARRDNLGKPFLDPQFARRPCVDFHRESRLLWFANVGLYVLAMAGVGWVGWRRMRSRTPLQQPATA